MWLLPSRGRPHLIPRVFSLYPPTEPGILIVDDDQYANYAGLELPKNWFITIDSHGGGIGAIVNRAFEMFPDRSYYGLLSDDMIPKTIAWDVRLAALATPRNLVGASTVHGKRMGAIAMGGDLARVLGWVLCPAVRHFYGDDIMEMMVEAGGFKGLVPEIEIEHLHFTYGLSPMDETYMRRGNPEDDRVKFERWKETEWMTLQNKLNSLLR